MLKSKPVNFVESCKNFTFQELKQLRSAHYEAVQSRKQAAEVNKQEAAEHNVVDVIEYVLKMKKGAAEKQGMATAYSHLLSLYANKGDVESVEKTFDQIIKDGVTRNSLRVPQLKKAEEFLTEKGKPLPTLAEDTSSSSSESDSSSSDEGKKKGSR